ncbi:hypothetical protein U1Q18_027387 [Sarracenia purpurea var. burkii]
MISGCARLGKTGNVLLLLDEMPERNIPSWSVVIAGRILNGLFSEAIPLFRVSPSPGRGAELWSGRVPELCVRFDYRALRFYPNLGAVYADQGTELGLADLLPTGMLFADLLGVNMEDLAGAVDDGVANALFLRLNAGRYGIRVQVRSVYIEGRSQPLKGQYFYAYRIRITNNSDRPVQLLRRHWIITDANGKTENVRGIGVIGEQPVILPNTGFEYSSACPLSTPSGRMEGDLEMKHIDKVGSKTFNVAIAPFSLSTLGDDTDTF